MEESTEAIKKLIDECSADEQRALKKHLSALVPEPLEREWGVDAETILSAIRRSSDLTKRGVRGIIAEAVFENSVMPVLEAEGWRSETLVGDFSYDVKLSKDSFSARIQIKLQRLVKGEPFLYYPKFYEKDSLYVVEVQKTRTGKKKERRNAASLANSDIDIQFPDSETVNTRPYSFNDFDILAVNMHPSSRDWKDFRYTIASWLLPRPSNKSLIEIMQPVAAKPNSVWTNDLRECLEWLRLREERKVLTDLLHRKPKGQPKKKKKLRKNSKVRD